MSDQSIERARVILPIPDQASHHLTTYDAKDPDNRFPPIAEITPPESTFFNGKIKWVELAVGEDNFSHLVKPEDLMHMLLSKQ